LGKACTHMSLLQVEKHMTRTMLVAYNETQDVGDKRSNEYWPQFM